MAWKEDLNQQIEAARSARANEDRRREEERREHARRHAQAQLARDEFMHRYLRPATMEDYLNFLMAYMADGGEISVSNGEFNRDHEWFVAVRDFDKFPSGMCGTLAFKVIVPRGINAPRLTGNMAYGHCNLYFVDDHMVYPRNSVPVYSDTRF